MNKPIFFYSKNCPICRYLAENINIDWYKYFNMINVDNKKIRDKILSSTHIRIKKVPCILSYGNDNTIINKYEGEIVYQWIIQNIVNSHRREILNKHNNERVSKPTSEQLPKTNNHKISKTENKIENKEINKKPIKSILKKVNFDDSKNEKKEFTKNVEESEDVSFIDEDEIKLIKNAKDDSTLKDRLNKPNVEILEADNFNPSREADNFSNTDDSLQQKKKDVKGTSAVLHLARQMQTDRESEFKDNGHDENQENIE